ncbi:Pleiotropic drug resistance protein abc superfamily, partial [Globisporangium polare]
MELGGRETNDADLEEQVAATDIVLNDKGGGSIVRPIQDGDIKAPAQILPRIRFDSNEGEAGDTVSSLMVVADRTGTRYKSTTVERYSSLDTSNVESLMSGGFNRYLGKYKSVRREYNLTFPTPEIHFEDLS